MSFYEVLDDVFDNINKQYGKDNDTILEQKEQLKYVYENENKWKCNELLKIIKPKKWYINTDGVIVSIASTE
jgi:hypothetical protein